MSLARFYPRIADALGPVIGTAGGLREFLGNTVVLLEASSEVEGDSSHHAGFELAVNLCARLYPRICIRAGKALTDESASLALRINPKCEIETQGRRFDGALAWGCSPSVEASVVVSPAGWNIFLDDARAEVVNHTNVLTALGAGAVAVGELFRTVFGKFLQSGRTRQSPGTINLLTLDDSISDLPKLPNDLALGRIHIAGAGAIGQAALFAFAKLGASGSLVVVDPEAIALSNLQRYVLAFDDDVGATKCAIAARSFQNRELEVIEVQTAWGDDDRTIGMFDCVCTALDTVAARIGVQVGLPRRIYNAWTQPADVGWSFHESFGEEPCLACLYIPSGPRPSQHELISRAVRQHELRVLAYLTLKLPVDIALRPEQIPRLPTYPIPNEAATWVDHSILDDMAGSLGIDSDGLLQWKGKQLSDLYREGICGGAIITEMRGEISRDVMVPMAHQSALAGIMLAAQVAIASCPELRRCRPEFTEARFDVLAGFPQVLRRPRQRAPGCFCSDPSYIHTYHEKWG